MSDAPPPPPPAYSPPPGAPVPAQGGGKGLAITALVVGILSILAIITVVGGIPLGLVAIVVGLIGAGKAKRGKAAGRGMAITGVVLGAVGILLSVLALAGIATFFNSDTGQNLTECLQNAGDDTAAQQKCEDEFRRDLGN